MTEHRIYPQERQRGPRGLAGAIILIGIGVALLLQNMGVIQLNWWLLWRFWPVAIILIGLDLLLSRSMVGSIAVAILGLVIVGVMIFWAGTSSGPALVSPSGNTVTRQIEQELGDVTELERVEVAIGAASARISPLSDSRNVVEGEFRTDEALNFEIIYDTTGSTGRLRIEQQGERNTNLGSGLVGDLNLRLTDAVPIDNLIVEAGVGDFTLDLTGLQIRLLTLQSGVGRVTAMLPDRGDYVVNVEAAMGSVRLTVPEGLEARVSVDGFLSNIDLPNRFKKIGDGVWQTMHYDTAENRVTIQVSNVFGNVQIGD